MSESPISVARFGFFVCFVGLIAVGYYAYTLRNNLASANESVSTQEAQIASWKTKFDDSEKTSKTNADVAVSCQQNIKQLQEQLATTQASNAGAVKTGSIGKTGRKR